MAYRLFRARTQVADDSNLDQLLFDREILAYQTKDLEVYTANLRVGPSDSEAQVTLGTITTGYFLAVYSDYPIRVRLNGVSATQYTLTSTGVAATNLGGPLPDQCIFLMTGQITSLYVQPITGATQTANCRIVVTGDPQSSYI